MILLGDVADIVTGLNAVRVSESVEKYTNEDFESDYWQMKLASQDNAIIYRPNAATVQAKRAAAPISDGNRMKFISQIFFIMKPDVERLNPLYLCYIVNESREIARQYSLLLQGSVLTKLSARQLKQVHFNLPALAQQEKIGQLYATALYQHYLEMRHADMKLDGIMTILHKGDIQ